MAALAAMPPAPHATQVDNLPKQYDLGSHVHPRSRRPHRTVAGHARLPVEHGSLYPALQRLESKGWIRAKWGVSDNNRRARSYEITSAGRRQLLKEASEWKKLVKAIGFVLGPEAARG